MNLDGSQRRMHMLTIEEERRKKICAAFFILGLQNGSPYHFAIVLMSNSNYNIMLL